MLFCDEKNEIFKEAFGVDIFYFADPIVRLGLRKWSFDVIKFDEYCHYELGYDEDSSGSLKDFIQNKYGETVLDLVISLMESF